jgi:glycosyltransferase involved in cell wall biosynthesis
MEKPVVSTSVGCEGIDVVHGEHLLIADDPAAFANAVLELMRNRDLATRLGKQGRNLTEERYKWESVVSRLEAFYDRLLADGGSRAAQPASPALASRVP